MFAIAFDLVVADVQKHHPKGVAQAYIDIRATLGSYVSTGSRVVFTSARPRI
jgi:virulence-associated protein VapD